MVLKSIVLLFCFLISVAKSQESKVLWSTCTWNKVGGDSCPQWGVDGCFLPNENWWKDEGNAKGKIGYVLLITTFPNNFSQ